MDRPRTLRGLKGRTSKTVRALWAKCMAVMSAGTSRTVSCDRRFL